ncbi:MAG TPA: aminotransferase class I/II-fold pyridoxal phosphate-dependent enzyme [Gemmatimonadales bacterium]|nr:aminotransferase class I/II-fold pyridoxal phosphate-dependent enzyme [Gemmatimonadales bacterium]
MSFEPFAMERWQSTWENRVRYNISESGVHPLSVAELLALAGEEPGILADSRLGYPQSNGTEPLRAAIAALYPGATPDNVLVTNGSAEANFCACWRLVQPGDRVAIVLPTYMQTWGLAKTFGARIVPIWLREERAWQPDPAEIDVAIAAGTKLVVVTNPNNPTGAVLADEAVQRLVRRAAETGAWLLADEVYQGAERESAVTPSLWGRAERVLVTNGLSKAYGLPGLRIGWCVAPPALVADLWARKDYTTIGPSVISDRLATLALQAGVRHRILARTRGILQTNWPVLERWLRDAGDQFTFRAPDAGAICYARYRAGVNSSALAERLRIGHDVLIVPGDQFGMDHFIRFGFGPEKPDLEAALARVAAALRALD